MTLTINGTGALTQTEILGGGGADSITVNGLVSGTGFEINGDSSANGGGNDTITLVNALSGGSTVRGKGGADLISISGMAGTGIEVLGNAGDDTITISDNVVDLTGTLIGGGQGNDDYSFGLLWWKCHHPRWWRC